MKKGGDGKGKDGKGKEMGKGKSAGTLHETVRIHVAETNMCDLRKTFENPDSGLVSTGRIMNHQLITIFQYIFYCL